MPKKKANDFWGGGVDRMGGRLLWCCQGRVGGGDARIASGAPGEVGGMLVSLGLGGGGELVSLGVKGGWGGRRNVDDIFLHLFRAITSRCAHSPRSTPRKNTSRSWLIAWRARTGATSSRSRASGVRCTSRRRWRPRRHRH